MKARALPMIALVCALGLFAAACSGNTNGSGGTGGTASPSQGLKSGGTMHVALVSDVTATMDPSREYYSESFSLLHDMTRTLLSYKSVLGPQGNIPIPDLASALPTITNNNTTWTFHLRPGVMFGPPISRPITCTDFQTAFQREFTKDIAAGYAFYYTVIKGATDFQNGKAKTISGIQCPDPNTVVFQLTQPTGDFNYRLTLPASAPMPADAIKGHDQNYGRYLVSSGCWMWQGEDQVNFDLPLKQQQPAVGYQPGKSMTLVRNPNWKASTDPIRKCYADRVEISIGGTPSDLFNKVQAGSLDFVDDTPSDATSLRTFRADPTLRNQISALISEDSTYYIAMNTTVAPFDDIHVRKAVNYIINKDALLRLRGGPDFGSIATHIVPPSMAGALPASYDPYATPNHQGSLQKAQAEMKLSKYDPKQDGQCDVSVCKGVLTISNSEAPAPDLVASMQSDLAKIGITMTNRALETGTMYDFYGTPAKKIALFPSAAWVKDYADQLTFIQPLFDGDSISPTGNVNTSMVNNSTVNSQITACGAMTGTSREQCWAALDKYLMENVVPWVPWRWGQIHYVYSNRIAHFAESQFTAASALDGIALTSQAIAQPG